MKRVLLGDRSQWGGGGHDLWVSKPGHDVRFAGYGNLMLGGNTGISQVLHSDFFKLSGPPTALIGLTHYINLPSQFAGLSGLVVLGMFQINIGESGELPPDLVEYYNATRGAFRVISGQVEAVHLNTPGVGSSYGNSNAPRSLWVGYTVYRASL